MVHDSFFNAPGDRSFRHSLRRFSAAVLAVSLCGAVVGTVAVATAAPAGAATVVGVGHGDLSPSCAPTTNWYSSDDVDCGPGAVSFVTGPATPPLGTGSAELSTATSADRSLLANLDPAYAGIPFSDFTTLQYSTYRSSVDAGNNLAISLQFDVDYDITDTTTSYQGRVVFEPYQTFPGGVPQNTWQSWNALTGKWWASSSSPIVGNATVAQACPQTSPCTWTNFLAHYPNAGMRAAPNSRFLFKAGNTWPGFVGNVDDFTFGVNGTNTTYDFDPITCSTDCYVAPTGSNSNSGFANDPLQTIQAGVNAVAPGGTVHVAAGTYDERVTVNKSITLLGAQAGVDARTRSGSESVIAPPSVSPAGQTPLWVAANDVTVDGFTVTGNTYVPLVGAGVYLEPGTHGSQVVNNIIDNNVVGLFLANNNGADPTLVQHNLFENNTNPGSASANDIYADNFTADGAIDGATIDANTFTNSSYVDGGVAVDLENTTAPTQFSNIAVSNNEIDNHGRGVIFTGTSDSSVTGNDFVPGPTSQVGVYVWDGAPYFVQPNSNISITGNSLGCASSCAGDGVDVSDAAATGIAVNRNSLAGLAPGIASNATATVDGTCNWWGGATGPGGTGVGGTGTVSTIPWLVSSDLTGSCSSITGLNYTGDTTGTEGHFVTLSATLTGEGGVPVANEPITFTLGTGGSAQTAGATTNSLGVATTTSLVPDQDATSVPLAVAFAGDGTYNSTSTSSAIVISKAVSVLAMTSPADVFISTATPTLVARATLTSPVVTSTGTTNGPVAGRAVSFVVCHSPTGACYTFTGGLTNASGVSTLSTAFSHPRGQYTIRAVFNAGSDLRYTGITSSTMPLYVVQFYTRIVAKTSGGQYRGGVVVSFHLDFGFIHGKLGRVPHSPVSVYLMPNATSTDFHAGKLIGTVTTGSTGEASILYRMNSLAHPPAAGSKLSFVVVYAGSSDLTFGNSQSPTATQTVVQPLAVTRLAVRHVSPTAVDATVTLTLPSVTYKTKSNNVFQTVTIPSLPIADATVTVQFLNGAGGVIGSFTAETNATGTAVGLRQIPRGAVKMRALYSASTMVPTSVSNIVTL